MTAGGQKHPDLKNGKWRNLNPPFRVIAETKGGTNPYLATDAGGMIQSLLMGFGGLDITSTGNQTGEIETSAFMEIAENNRCWNG